MNQQFIEARELIIKARESLRHGDKKSARLLGEKAVRLAPAMEDVWLVLAASDPNPQDALAYARKALEINPQSTRAQRGVEWASEQLSKAQAKEQTQPRVVPTQVATVASLPQKHAYQTAVAMPMLQPQRRTWLLPALLVGAVAVAFLGFLALFVLNSSALRSLFVAAMMRTSAKIVWLPPTLSNFCSCKMRKILACVFIDISPISSKKTDPRGGHTSNQPCRSCSAPVKAPRR